MRLGDIIVAVASPPGWSARGVIRLSGPGAWAALGVVMEGPPVSAGCVSARLRLGGDVLPVLLIAYAEGRSYTGEDSAEILLPGSPLVLDRVLGLLAGLPGVRLAEPGEFTARAYLAGRLTLEQAEGVAATIAAQSEGELESARELLAGRAGARYRAWADEVTTLLALVEAGIDFSDQEDVTAIASVELRRRLLRVLAELLESGGAAVSAGRTLPRVVLAGAPNAGKSTLFNALLGRRRAVVSAEPGTTRDALEEPLDLGRDVPGAGTVLLVDAAGLEAPRDAEIAAAMRGATRAALRSADLVVHCDPDGRFPALPIAPRSALRVRTKSDRAAAGGSEELAVCALDGWNLGALRAEIARLAIAGRASGLAALLPRHRAAMARAAAHLAEAAALARAAAGAEVMAGELRPALDALGELVGRIDADRVLGRVFAAFCVGK